MSLSDLASVGSFVSGVAVLISLVYLALQVRHSANTQRSETQSSATQRRMEFLLHLTNADLAVASLKGGSGDPDISPLQLFQFSANMQASWTTWEDEFFQHFDGMFDERRFRLATVVAREMFRLPGVRALWRTSKTNFHPKFVAHMVRLIQEVTPTLKSGTDAWFAAAAEEHAAAIAADARSM